MTHAALFPELAEIDASAADENRMDFSKVPAKAAVYLLVGRNEAAEEQPVLLATVGDLRSALKNRLADTPPDAKSKRINYGTLCTRVYYRRVDSSFAANYWYARAAEELFPATAKALIPWRDSWWVAVEKTGTFPRFRKTTDLSEPSLAYVGPISDKHAANRYIELLEDLFDLCRYHNILVQAPHGKACAYKEMGKCPAPCDGSISLVSYREQIDAALGFAAGTTRAAWRAQTETAMKHAAAEMQFERAGRIKQRLARADAVNTYHFAHVRPLEDFSFLTLQPGKGKPWIEPWVMTHGQIECLPQFNVKTLPEAAEALAQKCRQIAMEPAPGSMDRSVIRQMALAAHHLFKGESDHGIWLRASEVRTRGPAAVVEAVERLREKKASKPMTEQATDTLAPGESDEPAESEPHSNPSV